MEPNQYVASGDLQLAVYRWGKAAARRPTVLFVHGYPDNASVWSRIAEALAGRFDVVAYDVRGAGRSSAPQRVADYRIERLNEDLAAVIDAVSPDRPVHLVGHDWGAIQSWEAVAGPRLAGRIASYTPISGPSLDHAAVWLRRRLGSRSPAQWAKALRQFADSWYMMMFQVPGLGALPWQLGLDTQWPKLLARREGAQVEADASRRQDGIRGVNLYRANFLPRLLRPHPQHIGVPVQLIVPTRDPFMEREIWDELADWAPDLYRREIDAGHWVPLTHPDALADYIAEFVTSIDGGDAGGGLKKARVHGRRKPFTDKLVVVTGAGSGIGRETLLSFAEQGATVVAADLNFEAAQRSAELARLLDADAYARKVDVGSVAQMEAFAQAIERDLGAPDIVVNNAGIGMAGAVLDTTTEEWDRILRVNLGGVIHGSRLFGRQMVAAGKKGHIVNVSSGLAFFPTRATPAYATTKAAVRMLSECLRAELADQNIGVSAIYPGIVDTGIVTRTRFAGADDTEQARRQARTQQLYSLRNLKPKAVASAIIDAVRHDKAEVPVGIEVRGIRVAERISPALVRRLARAKLG